MPDSIGINIHVRCGRIACITGHFKNYLYFCHKRPHILLPAADYHDMMAKVLIPMNFLYPFDYSNLKEESICPLRK